MQPRQITSSIMEDLDQKMVLLSGPRQCGKTTLAKEILRLRGGAYYNWDVDQHRRMLRQGQLDQASELWVLDEVHKNRRWRNWLKGIYDLHHDTHRVLVTGSARLEFYGRGGDSLQGRYFMHHLHPFTLSEALQLSPLATDDIWSMSRAAPTSTSEVLDTLLRLGGFPEPFLGGTDRGAARWRLNYHDRVIQEEIRSLERIEAIDRLELLSDRLPEVVGSLLSINKLSTDLEVAFETVRKWLKVFERLYLSFRIPPFGTPKVRAVKKSQKLYLWDWGAVIDPASRLENLVAVHLLRLVHWLRDVEGQSVELRFFRTRMGHEVDFVLLNRGKPWVAIEVKQGARSLAKGMRYLLERYTFSHAFQVSLAGTEDWLVSPINGCSTRMMPLARFLANLP